jgi:hypothetical protein
VNLNEVRLRVSLLLPAREIAFSDEFFLRFLEPRPLPSLPFCFPPLRRHLMLEV